MSYILVVDDEKDIRDLISQRIFSINDIAFQT